MNIALIWLSAVSVPFTVSFDYEPSYASQVVGYAVDCFFGFDLMLNFCTGLEMQDKTVTYSPRYIVLSYVRGWLLVDFVSAFPWELCSPESESSLPQVLKVLKLSKLLRLLRMFRLLL